MAWEHKMARELKKRDNPTSPAWMLGVIISIDPLAVSVAGGAVILRHPDTLSYLIPPPSEEPPFEEGQRVAVVGDIFGRGPGSQKALLLGRCM